RGFNPMEDLDRCVNLTPLFFPKMLIAHLSMFIADVFIIAALNPLFPAAQRKIFAKRALDLIDLATVKILILNNPEYQVFYLSKNVSLCLLYTILGDLSRENKRSKYFQKSYQIFDEISKYDSPMMVNNYFYLMSISRIATLLAKNSKEKSEKIDYYQKAIEFLLPSKKLTIAFFHIETIFSIGEIYYKWGILANNDEILKKSYLAYIDAIEYCKNKGYHNLVGSAYINLARIEDRLGNFISAAEHYKNAIDSFDHAILTLTYTKLSKRIEKLREYLQAWNLIEQAKSYHIKENYNKAQITYEEASRILKNIHEYEFEAPFYSAWAILEKAEDLSRKNKHEEAAATYLVVQSNFGDTIEILNSYLSKRKALKEKERISKLIQAAKIRETYCSARYNLETGRLESKKGNHIIAAELYNKAGMLFENLCQEYRIERERNELTAIYYLCKAWVSMEQADVEQKPALYAKASELFQKASIIFPESQMKKLSLGNSLYCSALKSGSLFDKTTDLNEKQDFYKKIKMFLRESSKNYSLGGFEQDASWALATSTFFDGIWHLIQSDNQIDFSKKNALLNIATKYLNSALQIFENAGYKQKEEEIRNYLQMIKDEKAILTSALNVIEKPEISESTIGISAPTCPGEVSSSVSIGEMQRHDLTTESEVNWYKRIHHLYLFMPSGICLYQYSFKSKEEEVEAHLVAGGLTGISALIQEVTKSETKIKKVEQEEMTILLEHGKFLTAALITEENLVTLQNKLVKLIQDVEDFFQEELESFSGNLSLFSKIEKFIIKTFEK
ncbi:MAG: tetratricopeptide repeat protein, partial [Candidatus Hodarchaeota archaeon]